MSVSFSSCWFTRVGNECEDSQEGKRYSVKQTLGYLYTFHNLPDCILTRSCLKFCATMCNLIYILLLWYLVPTSTVGFFWHVFHISLVMALSTVAANLPGSSKASASQWLPPSCPAEKHQKHWNTSNHIQMQCNMLVTCLQIMSFICYEIVVFLTFRPKNRDDFELCCVSMPFSFQIFLVHLLKHFCF